MRLRRLLVLGLAVGGYVLASAGLALVFAEADHIGGIVHNVHNGTFHGVSWGSRLSVHMESWREG